MSREIVIIISLFIMNTSLSQRTASALLDDARSLGETPALLGFDGFIDSILHVVDQRQSANEYTRVRTLLDYGNRISNAAGKSTNVELVLQAIKLGGNGPIMANAMCALGVPVTYCGMVGFPHVQPVFSELEKRARVLSFCDAALTDAIEFDDGKLIVGKHANVTEANYDTILERIGEMNWHSAWGNARFVAMVNWTMLPHMTEIWRRIMQQNDYASGERKTLFFDLADPEKRTDDDIREALETISHFAKDHDVILGLNEKEGEHVARVLDLQLPTENESHEQQMMDTASAIRARLQVQVCIVHPTQFAAGADCNGAAVVHGPFTTKPKISTGAGDHFNSGFCVGHLLGLGLEGALQTGVGVSGFYVRTAVSPSRRELAEFLTSLDD